MSAVTELLAILDLEERESNRLQGRSPQVGWQRIFGGLVISQALVAAMRSVKGALKPHSLHAYFILPGDPALPIDYEVENLRDGRSFATRRVVARQNKAAIFALSCSFHLAETGYDHQLPMPSVPEPESLMSEKDMVAAFREKLPENVQRYFLRDRPIELRPVDFKRYLGAESTGDPNRNPVQHIWFRAAGSLPDDPAIHLAVLAYASDMTLLDTALVAHGKSVFNADIQAASLDHAMWFHRPFRVDDWLLYAQDSPSSAGALGLSRGTIYSRDGRLVASVCQEGLIRPRPDRKIAQ
ncbi:MAG: acyl-CoA thioesterase II [Beijerinckiaceae bacterium]